MFNLAGHPVPFGTFLADCVAATFSDADLRWVPGARLLAAGVSPWMGVPLWIGDPVTIRLDDLDVICSVLECSPADLLIREPEAVAARRPAKVTEAGARPVITPRPGRHRSVPPA